jgi:hypothetical protein
MIILRISFYYKLFNKIRYLEPTIKDKQTQLEKFEELKRKIGIKESVQKMGYLKFVSPIHKK